MFLTIVILKGEEVRTLGLGLETLQQRQEVFPGVPRFILLETII